MLNKYRLIIGVLAGLPLLLLYPIGILLFRESRQIYLLKNIYFLNNYLGPNVGPLVTDFGRFFLSGVVAAAISYKRPLLAAMLVGVLGPIIGKIIADGSLGFDSVGRNSFLYFLINMLIFSLVTLIGGLFYKFILARLFARK